MMKAFGILMIVLFVWVEALGQGQITALPMAYNPAFAGSSDMERFAVYSGIERQHISGFPSRTYYAGSVSYDRFISRVSTGVGMQAGYMNNLYTGNDIAALRQHLNTIDLLPGNFTGGMKGFNFAVSVSPKISFRGKYTLAPAIGIGYQKSEAVTYLSGIYPVSVLRTTVMDKNLTAGIMLNTSKYYLGYSMMFSCKNFYYASSGKIFSAHSVIQGSYVFRRKPGSKFSFTPVILLKVVTGHDRQEINESSRRRAFLLVNLNFRYKKLVWGLLPGAMVGIQKDLFLVQAVYSPFTYSSGSERFGKKVEVNLKLAFRGKKGEVKKGRPRL